MLPSDDARSNRMIADLAADLTDSALEAVARSGRGSVDLELSLWHALSERLEYESRPGAYPGGTPREVLEGAVRWAVADVTGFEAKARPRVAERQGLMLAGLLARRLAAAGPRTREAALAV
jgi:hypothetical protein